MQSKIPVKKRPLPIIRVFVSSTFSDLEHERNALHAQVWPELERYCQQRGFTFQAIDLRWGVPAETGLDHRTMRICFEELRRSQETSPEPNFLILLGNRYGWRPLPEVISVEEFQKLKTAAQEIQRESPDLTRKPTSSQVELLKQAVAVLEDWYLLDENAKPFGETFPIGEYILRSRKQHLRGVDYGKYLDASGGSQLKGDCREGEAPAEPRFTSDDAHLTGSAGASPSQQTGKLRDTAAWVDVQFVLWSIVNRAFPAEDFAKRFQTLHETSPGTVPSSVRFQASATEQEIWQGTLQVENADRHVIAAVREIDNLDAFPNRPRRGDFIDLKDDGTPDADSWQAVNDLKAELKRRLVRSPIIRSRSQWAVDKDNKPTGDVTITHLDKFCRTILKRFKKIIINQIGAYWRCDLRADDATLAQVRGSQQELDLECADHLRFAAERAPEKTFVGRSAELRRIRKYLLSDAKQPYVVYGPSGSGKTALLGRAILRLKKLIAKIAPPRSADCPRAKICPIVLTRFLGTTPESSNLRSLMSSLCRELRQDFEMTAPLPTDLNELIDEFYLQLGKATAARPVFVFLDALDQIDASDNARLAYWIRSPLTLPGVECYARMVVACLSPSADATEDGLTEQSEPCEPYRELKARRLLNDHVLGALEKVEACKLFDKWLHEAGRRLSPQQSALIETTLTSPICRQPLYLKVLFEEARHWRWIDGSPFIPTSLPETLPKLLAALFDRLDRSSEHGELIGIALSCLVSARYGLSEGELLEILFEDPAYKAILATDNKRNGHELPLDSNRIPIAPWTRLRSDIAPYLSERAAPGTAVMHFYHRQVEQAVRKRYLHTPDQQTGRHRQLANYFDGRWNRPDVHALVELPWLWFRVVQASPSTRNHERQNDEWKSLSELLSNLSYIQAICQAHLIYGLVNDYLYILEHTPQSPEWPARDLVESFYRFTSNHAHVLANHTELTLPLACNEPDSSPVAQSAGRYNLQEPWFRLINKPSHESFCAATLTGHCAPVTACAWSPDDKYVVSASQDKTLRVWDSRTGRQRLIISDLDSWLSCLCCFSDGRRIVSGSTADGRITVFDSVSGQEIVTSDSSPWGRGAQRWILGCAVAADGRTVLCGFAGMHLATFDAESSGPLNLHFLRTDGLATANNFSFSSDNRLLVSAGTDQILRIWDVETKECIAVLEGHDADVTACCFSPDGSLVASGSDDKTVRIWQAQTGKLLKTYTGAPDKVTACAWKPDGRHLATGCWDGTVMVWATDTGASVAEFSAHNNSVTACTYSPNGRFLLSASSDGNLRIWDSDRFSHTESAPRHTGMIDACSFSPDGKLIVTGGSDHSVRLWNGKNGQMLRILDGHTDRIPIAIFSPDSRWILTGSWDGTLRCTEASSGNLRWRVEAQPPWGEKFLQRARLEEASFSPDGERFYAIIRTPPKALADPQKECRYQLRSSATGELLCEKSGVFSAAFSPDGFSMAVGLIRSGFQITHSECGLLMKELRCDVRRLAMACVFSPDGHWLATAWDDGHIRIFPTQRGWWSCSPSAQLLHDSIVETLFAYSPDGQRILTAAADGTIHLWNSRNHTLELTLAGHTMPISRCAFSTDARRVFSVSTDNTVRIWDCVTGKLLTLHHGVQGCCFSLDGQSIAVFNAGALNLLRLEGFALDPPLVTAINRFRCSSHEQDTEIRTRCLMCGTATAWDRDAHVLCPLCGTVSPLPPGVLAEIHKSIREARLASYESPCTTLPKATWANPQLLDACNDCGHQLRFNPFLVNNIFDPVFVLNQSLSQSGYILANRASIADVHGRAWPRWISAAALHIVAFALCSDIVQERHFLQSGLITAAMFLPLGLFVILYFHVFHCVHYQRGLVVFPLGRLVFYPAPFGVALFSIAAPAMWAWLFYSQGRSLLMVPSLATSIASVLIVLIWSWLYGAPVTNSDLPHAKANKYYSERDDDRRKPEARCLQEVICVGWLATGIVAFLVTDGLLWQRFKSAPLWGLAAVSPFIAIQVWQVMQVALRDCRFHFAAMGLGAMLLMCLLLSWPLSLIEGYWNATIGWNWSSGAFGILDREILLFAMLIYLWTGTLRKSIRAIVVPKLRVAVMLTAVLCLLGPGSLLSAVLALLMFVLGWRSTLSIVTVASE